MTLYIIGNGFDLYHKLKTRYLDFKDYLKKYNPSLFELLSKSFPLNDDYQWNNFEETIGKFQIDKILSELDDFLPDEDNERSGLEWIYQDQAEEIVKELSNNLKNAINDWIISTIDYKSIKSCNNISFSDCKILTFNYTQVIEKIYGIPQNKILHIHGIAYERKKNLLSDSDEEDCEIIIGHSNINLKKYSRDDRKGVYQNLLKSFSFEILEEVIRKLRKNSEQLITQYDSFFNSLSNCDKVIILGHSLGSCDMPYLKKIADSIMQNAKYVIYYHCASDKEKLQKKILTLQTEHKKQSFQLVLW